MNIVIVAPSLLAQNDNVVDSFQIIQNAMLESGIITCLLYRKL